MQLIDVRNDPIFQALFPQKQFGWVLAIWLQSYLMICVKAMKIILALAFA